MTESRSFQTGFAAGVAMRQQEALGLDDVLVTAPEGAAEEAFDRDAFLLGFSAGYARADALEAEGEVTDALEEEGE